MTILITGATGNVGSAVVRELSARGAHVRAFVRDPAAAAARLGDEVELAVGDFADDDSVRRALRGVDRLFLSSGDGPTKVSHERAVVDAAAAAGVELIVKASTWGADPASPLPGLAFNGRVEAHVRNIGIPAVHLRSAFYMTNLLSAAEQVRATGKLFAPAGAGATAMIDPRDIGAVGAAVLTGDGHAARCYTLTGPEAITYADVARVLTDATGRRVEYVDVPPHAAREGLAQSGMPDWLIAHLDGAFEHMRRGAFAQTTDTVRVLTGRDGRTFVDFASEHAGLFASLPAPTAGT